jgi:superfamily II DNA helicase RecQ
MAAARPCNQEEFAAIPGVGTCRLERYGQAFIEEIGKEPLPAPA